MRFIEKYQLIYVCISFCCEWQIYCFVSKLIVFTFIERGKWNWQDYKYGRLLGFEGQVEEGRIKKFKSDLIIKDG